MPFANGRGIYGFATAVAPPSSSDLAETTTGVPTIQVGGGRFSQNALRCAPSASVIMVETTGFKNSTSGQASTNRLVVSFYARYVTKPVVTDTILWRLLAASGNNAWVNLDTVTGFWKLRLGATEVSTGLNPTLNTWYRFDAIFRMDLDPHTFEVRITADGASTYSYSGTATGPAGAAVTGRWFDLGSPSSSTQVIEFSDVLLSAHATAAGEGDFPITPQGKHHRVVPYLPNADGTHSVGSATFRGTTDNGGGYSTFTDGTTNAYSYVNTWPPGTDADGADHWFEKSAGTTIGDRIEIAFPDESGSPGTPIGVHTHVAVRNDAGTGSNLSLYQREGTTDHATLIHTGDPASGTIVYRGACLPLAPDGTAWSSTHINGAKVRFSSSDISPVPRVKGVLMEVAYVYDPLSFPNISWMRFL